MPGMIRVSVITAALMTAACAVSKTSVQLSQPEAAGPAVVPSDRPGVVPGGHEIDVRLEAPLSSATARPEQRFEARTVVAVTQEGRVLVPAGSIVGGIVVSVDRATRSDRTGRLVLAFDRLTVRGREHPIRAMATEAFESGGIREDASTAGFAAGLGGVIGGIIGGTRGAVLGGVAAGGGTLLATDGHDVELPAGTIVRLRMDAEIDVR